METNALGMRVDPAVNFPSFPPVRQRRVSAISATPLPPLGAEIALAENSGGVIGMVEAVTSVVILLSP